MNIKSIIILLFLLFANKVLAFPAVCDTSHNHIDISSKFTGQKVLVFGALIKQSDNVVVIVHGPKSNISITRKTKVLGVWTNSKKFFVSDVPQFYSISYIKDKFYDLNPILRKEFSLFSSEKSDFLDELINHNKNVKLYQVNNNVDIIDKHLFRCSIDFPSNIPKGKYTIEVIIFNGGKIVGSVSIPLFVNKVGIESWLFDMHYLNPLYYALLAISGALLIGWISSFLPKK